MSDIENLTTLMYDKVASNRINYFELLNVPTTATFKVIEKAYSEFANVFSAENINGISDPELKGKASFLAERGQRAFKVLGNHQSKMEYEKQGYSEEAPKSPSDDDPVDQARTLYGKAKVLYNSGRYDLAIITLKEAIKLDNEKASYYLLLGQSESKSPDKMRDAEKSLLKAAELEDWNAEPLAALGMLFYSARLRSKAESYFKRALELDPNNVIAKKKYTELVGPQISPMDKVKGVLAKALPSLFKK